MGNKNLNEQMSSLEVSDKMRNKQNHSFQTIDPKTLFDSDVPDDKTTFNIQSGLNSEQQKSKSKEESKHPLTKNRKYSDQDKHTYNHSKSLKQEPNSYEGTNTKMKIPIPCMYLPYS